MRKLLVSVFLVACVAAAPQSVSQQPSRDLDCLEHDNALFSCIFVKTVRALDRAARSSDIEIVDGVTLVRSTPMERAGKSLEKSELEMMSELPRDSADRTITLASMLYDSAVSFMKTHSLRLNMPEGSISRALVEGRGKIKKMVLPLIAAAGVKIFALVPILLGGLALLTLKALFVGKIALLVAGIMAFQKLFSGGGGLGAGGIFGKNPQVGGWYDNGAASGWSAGGGAAGLQPQGYYRRSLDEADAKVDAHNLAYSAHAPVASNAD